MGGQGSLASWQERLLLTHCLVSSGSVWSSYRKSCVDMVMKWLVPESSGRYVNRMTNEALHKGRNCPLVPQQGSTLILPWIPGHAEGSVHAGHAGCHRSECRAAVGLLRGLNYGWKRGWRNHQGACFWNFLSPVNPWKLSAGLDKCIMVLHVLLCRVLTEGSGRQ